MSTTEHNILPSLANLLATDGWYIHEYKVVASNIVTLTIVKKGEKEEAK